MTGSCPQSRPDRCVRLFRRISRKFRWCIGFGNALQPNRTLRCLSVLDGLKYLGTLRRRQLVNKSELLTGRLNALCCRRTVIRRRIQCRSDEALRLCASTLTASKPKSGSITGGR